MNSSYYNSSENNKFLCPTCMQPINPTINKIIFNNYKSLDIDLNEFTKISCQNCNFEFSFLFCEFCNRRIFMKIHPNSDTNDYNKLNGYNILCPYNSCQKFFYLSICFKCKSFQKLKGYVREGNFITCKNCNFQYAQIHIPIKFTTDIFYMEKNSNTLNSPNGIILRINNNEIMFQKINCYYCLRPIVFSSNKTKQNLYIECQQVQCPYQNCLKTFNRIICPKCYCEIYINDGFYEMGSLIRCTSKTCKNYHFGKLFCPHCKQINKLQKKFKLGYIKCGFGNCLKESNLVNCIFCRKLNIFDLKINVIGKTLKCGYCRNKFNEILCPFCRQINPFPLADFCFGKIYKCKYLTCMKKFQFLICPKCLEYSFSQELEEGKKMKCSKCQIRFLNFGCPYCKSNIIIYNSSFKIGQMIKCPNEQCGKIYCFICCSGCQKLIFSQENENLNGKVVICPYQRCKRITVSRICPFCRTNIVYSNFNKGIKEGEYINCEKCNKNYKFQNCNEICINEMFYLKEIEGKTIKYGVGEIDENYLSIQDLFWDFNKSKKISTALTDLNTHNEKQMYNVFNDNIDISYKDCIICHNNIKESVFFPCGHRCTCYNCAVITFTVKKKCPKCNKEIKCVIKKVYE